MKGKLFAIVIQIVIVLIIIILITFIIRESERYKLRKRIRIKQLIKLNLKLVNLKQLKRKKKLRRHINNMISFHLWIYLKRIAS